MGQGAYRGGEGLVRIGLGVYDRVGRDGAGMGQGAYQSREGFIGWGMVQGAYQGREGRGRDGTASISGQDGTGSISGQGGTGQGWDREQGWGREHIRQVFSWYLHRDLQMSIILRTLRGERDGQCCRNDAEPAQVSRLQSGQVDDAPADAASSQGDVIGPRLEGAQRRRSGRLSISVHEYRKPKVLSVLEFYDLNRVPLNSY